MHSEPSYDRYLDNALARRDALEAKAEAEFEAWRENLGAEAKRIIEDLDMTGFDVFGWWLKADLA